MLEHSYPRSKIFSSLVFVIAVYCYFVKDIDKYWLKLRCQGKYKLRTTSALLPVLRLYGYVIFFRRWSVGVLIPIFTFLIPEDNERLISRFFCDLTERYSEISNICNGESQSTRTALSSITRIKSAYPTLWNIFVSSQLRFLCQEVNEKIMIFIRTSRKTTIVWNIHEVNSSD